MEIREEAIRALGKVANAGGDHVETGEKTGDVFLSRGKRVGGFTYVLCSPRKLGRMNPF